MHQISASYLNPRLRYYYFRFRKRNDRHIGILFPVSVLMLLSSAACHSASAQQLLSKLVNPRHSYDVITIFKMAAAASQIYFWFRIWQRHSSRNIEIYSRTKFQRVILIHGWDITTSGFRKQTDAILKFYFRFRFWCFRRHRHVVLHQQTKFRPNRTIFDGVMKT